MQIVFLVSAIAFLKKAIDFCKYAANYEKNGVLTQVFTWAGGALGSLLLFTQTFAQHLQVISTNAGHLGGGVQAAIGVLFASLGSIFHDFMKSVDNSQSGAVPPLTKP